MNKKNKHSLLRPITINILGFESDNELDGEEIFNLTDDMIKTLFPTMKSQLRFIRARKALQDERYGKL